MQQRPNISCIVRHHDCSKLKELERCIFSVVGQTIKHLEIVLVLQRFTDQELEETKDSISQLAALRDDLDIKIVNLRDGRSGDARTQLLNLGLSHARGKLIGFLDYDDTLYPEAYELLSRQLQLDQCGVAFASVRIAETNIHTDFCYTTKFSKNVFQGSTLNDLFLANFCPLHSYIFDRDIIDKWDFHYDPRLTWEEDYDFLLQITSKTGSSFSLIGTCVGDYSIKSDKSNSIGIEGVAGTMSTEKARAYETVKARIELRRQTTLIAEVVQRQLGLSEVSAELTIRDYLDLLATDGR